jgi:hypothetical protein
VLIHYFIEFLPSFIIGIAFGYLYYLIERLDGRYMLILQELLRQQEAFRNLLIITQAIVDHPEKTEDEQH